jgi:uncharacterized repeat protein (TIGR01451 family)
MHAQEAWPLNSQWISLLSNDWASIEDASGDGPAGIDFVTDANGSAGYYYSTPTSLYFRMYLSSSPLQSPTNLRPFAWMIALDANLDGYLDWLVMLGGKSNRLWSYPNTTPYPDNTPDATPYFTLVGPLAAGYVRVTASPSPIYPNGTYLDIQIPYSTLQISSFPRNVYYTGTFAMAFASNTNEDANTVRDVTGNTNSFDEALAVVVNVTPTLPESYGTIYDTRDPSPISNAGIWYRNEVLTVSGAGWPASTSIYYNGGQRNIRIINSGHSLIWSGVLTTSASGVFSNYPLWSIGPTVPPDIYTILVEDPRNPGTYNSYDSFEIQAPEISVVKTTPDPLVPSGSNVSYTITISNTGNNPGNLSTIVDLLPDGFSYVSGSTGGLTTADPNISGNQLTWQGSWNVPVSGSISLTFTAKAALSGEDYANYVTINGDNFALMNTGPTAVVSISGPALVLSKSTDKTSAAPGDTITYTVSYGNTGNGDATAVFILENIPSNTLYVNGSAEGDGTIITYSHDGGISYDTDPTPPVTNLSFQRTAVLPPGGSGSVSFKVTVK